MPLHSFVSTQPASPIMAFHAPTHTHTEWPEDVAGSQGERAFSTAAWTPRPVPTGQFQQEPVALPTKQKHSPASEGLVTQEEARAFMAPVTPGLSVPHDGLPAKGATF